MNENSEKLSLVTNKANPIPILIFEDKIFAKFANCTAMKCVCDSTYRWENMCIHNTHSNKFQSVAVKA
jgi:hypothetical protein